MVHVQTNSPKKWIPILGLLTVATVAGSWWARDHWMGSSSSVTDAAPQVLASTSAVSAPAAALMSPNAVATPEQQKVAQEVLAEQADAAHALDEMGAWQPLKGPIKERPHFASIMEWEMLKGVSERQADPQAELTRLTNFLRYNKLLEKWQDLPANADGATRAALAVQIATELPQRVRNGEVEHQDALRQLPALLRDGYATKADRDKVSHRIGNELSQAQVAFSQSQASAQAPQN